jgi:hypothetical protein
MLPRTLVGQSKVNAINEVVQQFAAEEMSLIIKEEEYGEQDLETEIVITALDNMAARRKVWDKIQTSTHTKLLIDLGMGAEILHVYALDPRDPRKSKAYHEQLYSHEDIELPCSGQTIIYCPVLAASFASNWVKRFAVGEPIPYHVCFSFKDVELIKDA